MAEVAADLVTQLKAEKHELVLSLTDCKRWKENLKHKVSKQEVIVK